MISPQRIHRFTAWICCCYRAKLPWFWASWWSTVCAHIHNYTNCMVEDILLYVHASCASFFMRLAVFMLFSLFVSKTFLCVTLFSSTLCLLTDLKTSLSYSLVTFPFRYILKLKDLHLNWPQDLEQIPFPWSREKCRDTLRWSIFLLVFGPIRPGFLVQRKPNLTSKNLQFLTVCPQFLHVTWVIIPLFYDFCLSFHFLLSFPHVSIHF